MTQTLVKLLEKKHPTFTRTQEIKEICAPLYQLNITTFSHAKISPEGSMLINDNPRWMKIYYEKKYNQADFGNNIKTHPHLNYILWDSIRFSGETETLMKDAAEHQKAHGFTIIKRQASDILVYTFGADQVNENINHFYLNNYDILESFIHYFHDQIDHSSLMKSAKEFSLPSVDAGSTHESTLLNSNFYEKRNKFYRSIGKKDHLTPRELACIPLLMKGYSAPEIAEKLNISFRTVESYFASLKNKMGARNKEELIIKLMQFHVCGLS